MNALSQTKLTNFIQDDLWQSKIKDYSKTFQLYFDDWEPDNPLGSHKKINSIAAKTVLLPTIPPTIYSSLNFFS